MAVYSTNISDRDISWVSRSLLIPDENNFDIVNENGAVQKARTSRSWYVNQFNYWGLAATKYTDTTPGGNFWINPAPQSHIGADLQIPFFTDSGLVVDPYMTNRGFQQYDSMSRCYSEVEDDNAQVIFIRPGKPEFNSIFTFATGFYNTEMGRLARTGRVTGAIYTVSKYFGMAIALPFTLISSVFAIGRWLTNSPSSKFCYLRPTTHLFWNAANTILNTLMVNEGMYVPFLSDKEEAMLNADGGNSQAVYRRSAELYHEMLPDIFLASGGIDLFAYANRASRLAIRHHAIMNEMQEQSRESNKPISQIMVEHLMANRNKMLQDGEQIVRTVNGASDAQLASILSVVNSYSESDIFTPESVAGDVNADIAGAAAAAGATASEMTAMGRLRSSPPSDNANTERPSIYSTTNDKDESFLSSVVKSVSKLGAAYRAEAADGSAFIGFRVMFGGTNSESFSNSLRANDLESNFNSFSSSRRNELSSFGNFTVDNALVNMVKDALGSAVTGVADGIGASGLIAMAGQAFIDVPKQWDNSSYTAATMSYTIPLRLWSGDQITRLIDMHIPLSCALALGIPHSTGAASYNMPFMMEVWHRGWAQSRYCIMRNLTVTRGTGNIGWTQDRKPRGIDLQMDFEDASSIMHMPLVNPGSLNVFASLFGDENNFHDYLAVITGMSMADQVYIRRRWGLRLNRTIAQYRKFTSPHFYANMVNAGTMAGRIVNAFAREVGRP